MDIRLEFGQLQKKAEAQEYLTQILECPEYYGKNLDALHDILSEKIAAEPYVISIEGEGMEETDQWGYARGVLKVLKDLERSCPERLQVYIQGKKDLE